MGQEDQYVFFGEAGASPACRAELIAAALAGTAHVVRENVSSLKSEEKQKSYLEQLETVYRETAAREEEITQNF